MNNAIEISVEISVKNLNLWFGKFQALKNISIDIPKESGDGAYWPFRVWKIDFYQNA